MSRFTADAVVLDIEGTTGSAAHVRQVLFPYARQRIAGWFAAHRDTPLHAELVLATGAADEADAVRTLTGWADADVKAAPLKAVQARIWAEGYADGSLAGHVYEDVPGALAAWADAGIGRSTYSSGARAAQRDWFATTAYGDLTRHRRLLRPGEHRAQARPGLLPPDRPDPRGPGRTDPLPQRGAGRAGRRGGGRLADRTGPASGGPGPRGRGRARPPPHHPHPDRDPGGTHVSTATVSAPAEIGVIGGSGFYELLEGAEQVEVTTPFGDPSAPLSVGTVAGRRVAFLPRHGRDHEYPPHGINYRANIWALRAAGVRQILAPCAVGSLRRGLGPGTIVVPDQLVDRTSGRIQTFYDRGAAHVPFADPYCAHGTAVAAAAGGRGVHTGGAMVVIEGPRFSTRAESQWYAAQGWSLVNMTGTPEAVLARELAVCYTSLALVTDLDAGLDAHESVSQDEVFKVFAANTERMRSIVLRAVELLPAERTCHCVGALDGIRLPFELP